MHGVKARPLSLSLDPIQIEMVEFLEKHYNISRSALLQRLLMEHYYKIKELRGTHAGTSEDI